MKQITGTDDSEYIHCAVGFALAIVVQLVPDQKLSVHQSLLLVVGAISLKVNIDPIRVVQSGN